MPTVNLAVKPKTPTLVTGTETLSKTHVSEAGFTLIEVLMVVFIVGLAAGGIVMAFPDKPTELANEGVRFEQTIEALADRAVLTGNLHALTLTTDGYQASRREAGEWVPLPRYGRDLAENNISIIALDRPANREEVGPTLVLDPTGVPIQQRFQLTSRRRNLIVEFSNEAEVIRR